MKPRAIIWVGVACILCVAGIVHFSQHEKHTVQKQEFSSPSKAAACDAMSEAVTVPSDDELLQTATNGASPEFTLELERKWLADDPLDEKIRVSNLMLALCSAGQFRTALAVANAAPAVLQTNWLQLAFQRWAQQKPRDAIKALDNVTDPFLRTIAFHSVVEGWNQNDSAGLAAYAIALPDSDERSSALGEAFDNWSLQDPAALGTWLNTLPRGIEFDAGAAWMLSRSDGANRSAEVAMAWVENITNPALKTDSFNRVFAEWVQTDRDAALQYVIDANWLEESQRAKILDRLGAL